MSERRYMVAYGDGFDRRVQLAPESYGYGLLTREEAAQRIYDFACGSIEELRQTRDRALRILRDERKKAALSSTHEEAERE